ncbi:hypothetical protein LX15_005041 [Streptoalloteichus tenebrarius]|uniref:DUF885 domain-containing protein n=1 Tax=Streptoalloteichus tenebrarius (strain ATCC 17920 / DSM 40477 / JCM 4838 / CBS 697.72 / NBRC 16177 / NCIMB 11028 / NRRL B-12390 / A12253. 1 / ISP 5477) TaxID=1933 RepID=A0ABT1I166_STRSD|nr:hypothetical protein [Streptoalloteichus tenebrarius]MCP2261320.1 hypothetical protein [Streptoalloteichus tenebrarius]BFF03720.1 hypothetical protein GCM10020241_53950 [Streptoalloteichus tenebrarius]
MPHTTEEWLRDYALLALRLDRQLEGSATGTVLIYRGPQRWRTQAEREEPLPPGRLAEDAEALLQDIPFPPERARYLAAHVLAMRTVARRLDGEKLPLPQYAAQCLGIPVRPLPEELFEEAHSALDAALPRTPGSLTERLHRWQAAHTLPPDRVDELPALVQKAVAETRRRTNEIVALPDDEEVRCRLVSGVRFRAAGDHEGGVRSTIHINRDLPFNLADLLYVVTHEGHPGHIAESLLKERLLVEGQGRLEQQVRFMLAPSFVLSEGLGLHAQEIVFPGDEAQAWLTDNVLAAHGIEPDGSDFAAVHRAQNILFGVWANTALLAAEGRPDTELAAYLSRWALLSEAESGAALGTLRATGMALYVLSYFHGWRLLDSWLATPDRTTRVRRLLTEQLLPADLNPTD